MKILAGALLVVQAIALFSAGQASEEGRQRAAGVALFLGTAILIVAVFLIVMAG